MVRSVRHDPHRVCPQGLEVLEHVGPQPRQGRDHGRDRRNADNDSEGGQNRPTFIGPDLRQR